MITTKISTPSIYETNRVLTKNNNNNNKRLVWKRLEQTIRENLELFELKRKYCAYCGNAPEGDEKLLGRCYGCKMVYYCSKEHQLLDWLHVHMSKCSELEWVSLGELIQCIPASASIPSFNDLWSSNSSEQFLQLNKIQTWTDWFQLRTHLIKIAYNTLKLVNNLNIIRVRHEPSSDDLIDGLLAALTDSMTFAMTILSTICNKIKYLNPYKQKIVIHVLNSSQEFDFNQIEFVQRQFYELINAYGKSCVGFELIFIDESSHKLSISHEKLSIKSFSGTYKSFCKSDAYLQPDLLVSFHPHFQTESSLDDLKIILDSNLICLFTYQDELEKSNALRLLRQFFQANVLDDCLNQFASLLMKQSSNRPNHVYASNNYLLLIQGYNSLYSSLDNNNCMNKLQLIKSVSKDNCLLNEPLNTSLKHVNGKLHLITTSGASATTTTSNLSNSQSSPPLLDFSTCSKESSNREKNNYFSDNESKISYRPRNFIKNNHAKMITNEMKLSRILSDTIQTSTTTGYLTGNSSSTATTSSEESNQSSTTSQSYSTQQSTTLSSYKSDHELPKPKPRAVIQSLLIIKPRVKALPVPKPRVSVSSSNYECIDDVDLNLNITKKVDDIDELVLNQRESGFVSKMKNRFEQQLQSQGSSKSHSNEAIPKNQIQNLTAKLASSNLPMFNSNPPKLSNQEITNPVKLKTNSQLSNNLAKIFGQRETVHDDVDIPVHEPLEEPKEIHKEIEEIIADDKINTKIHNEFRVININELNQQRSQTPSSKSCNSINTIGQLSSASVFIKHLADPVDVVNISYEGERRILVPGYMTSADILRNSLLNNSINADCAKPQISLKEKLKRETSKQSSDSVSMKSKENRKLNDYVQKPIAKSQLKEELPKIELPPIEIRQEPRKDENDFPKIELKNVPPSVLLHKEEPKNVIRMSGVLNLNDDFDSNCFIENEIDLNMIDSYEHLANYKEESIEHQEFTNVVDESIKLPQIEIQPKIKEIIEIPQVATTHIEVKERLIDEPTDVDIIENFCNSFDPNDFDSFDERDDQQPQKTHVQIQETVASQKLEVKLEIREQTCEYKFDPNVDFDSFEENSNHNSIKLTTLPYHEGQNVINKRSNNGFLRNALNRLSSKSEKNKRKQRSSSVPPEKLLSPNEQTQLQLDEQNDINISTLKIMNKMQIEYEEKKKRRQLRQETPTTSDDVVKTPKNEKKQLFNTFMNVLFNKPSIGDSNNVQKFNKQDSKRLSLKKLKAKDKSKKSIDSSSSQSYLSDSQQLTNEQISKEFLMKQIKADLDEEIKSRNVIQRKEARSSRRSEMLSISNRHIRSKSVTFLDEMNAQSTDDEVLENKSIYSINDYQQQCDHTEEEMPKTPISSRCIKQGDVRLTCGALTGTGPIRSIIKKSENDLTLTLNKPTCLNDLPKNEIYMKRIQSDL